MTRVGPQGQNRSKGRGKLRNLNSSSYQDHETHQASDIHTKTKTLPKDIKNTHTEKDEGVDERIILKIT
jgi:hypothetical protein